ncbi:Alpha-mannosidase 2C1 [Physocladia obscura]|uniref:Alpha-mannosidase 2C1 n=1 Tax=Physocladia obscura TaxID=109957 RepID=A0AAD5XCZ8_9FUNG|nr:Alpha-mannosidase 2C1 [Physocladia obscura]
MNHKPTTTNLNTLQKHYDISIARLEKFIQRGQFSDVNLQAAQWHISANSAEAAKAVKLEAFRVPSLKRISFQEAAAGKYDPAAVGEQFGPSLATVWFRISVTITREFSGREVVFIFDASNEAMVWTQDGIPKTGLTGGAGDDRHVEYSLSEKATEGETFLFYIEMACNNRMGIVYDGAPVYNLFWRLETASIAIPNRPAQNLLLYFEVLLQLVKDTPREWQINADALYYADKIINTFRLNDYNALQDALNIATQFFKDRKKGGRSIHEVNAIGNCHIDTAWLWPYDETKRKAGRSWARQIMLMKSNPNFTFTASQAQQYEWVEQLYPTVFKDMQEYAKKGQFLPAGGTWVEMDCNMPNSVILKVNLENDAPYSGFQIRSDTLRNCRKYQTRLE